MFSAKRLQKFLLLLLVLSSVAVPSLCAATMVRMQTTLGAIDVVLYDEQAPKTVENFLYNYAERGFYEKTIFHYVEAGYLGGNGS